MKINDLDVSNRNILRVVKKKKISGYDFIENLLTFISILIKRNLCLRTSTNLVLTSFGLKCFTAFDVVMLNLLFYGTFVVERVGLGLGIGDFAILRKGKIKLQNFIFGFLDCHQLFYMKLRFQPVFVVSFAFTVEAAGLVIFTRLFAVVAAVNFDRK